MSDGVALDPGLIDRRSVGSKAAMLKARGAGLGRPPLSANAGRASRENQARTQTRYRLRRPDGAYLRLDGLGLTEAKEHAWIGTLGQLQKAIKAFPLSEGMTVIGVKPAVRASDIYTLPRKGSRA